MTGKFTGSDATDDYLDKHFYVQIFLQIFLTIDPSSNCGCDHPIVKMQRQSCARSKPKGGIPWKKRAFLGKASGCDFWREVNLDHLPPLFSKKPWSDVV